MELRDDKKNEHEAQAAAAMAELDKLADVSPPRLPSEHMATLLGQQHVELTRRFWAQRNAGEVCTIVGDHEEARDLFKQAKSTLMRIRALRDLAVQRDVGDRFAALVAEYEQQELGPREEARRAAVRDAVK